MSRPAARPRTHHTQVAATCRAHPGQWQQVSVHRARYAAWDAAKRIRTADRSRVYEPAGAFESRIEMYGDDWAVHARYIGQSHT